MFGAIIGDIVGSTFEAENNRNVYFEFLRSDSRFTDDTVCTAAIADILNRFSLSELTHDLISNELRLWCCAHINRGFGSMFHQWILNGINKPYNSFGNGALMRISPVAKYGHKNKLSLEETLELAKKFTVITHNHPQAIQSVECYIDLLYNFLNKPHSYEERIETIFKKLHQYEIPQPLKVEEYRVSIQFDLTSQTSLLVALSSILESVDFEDAIRNVVSIGGDSDTYAAITGPLAEAIWGSDEFKESIKKYFRPYDVPILETMEILYKN